VPAYFGLMKFYIAAILLAILINGIYPLWAVYYACDNFVVEKQESCLSVGAQRFIDFDKLLLILTANSSFTIA
jgi:hypothetical protein